jgi:type I restriction enzyme R subunit
MLTTGVDTKMVKLIVLEANIGSMTEFKQIIGRGTRIREAEGKVYFTIMDFRKATNLFADPDFDGEPVQIYEPGPEEDVVPPDVVEDIVEAAAEAARKAQSQPDISIKDEPEKPRKFHINNVEVTLAHERVQYYGADGKLITEALRDYTKKNVRREFASLDTFVQKWHSSPQKETLVKELAEQGVLIEALREEVGQDLDEFDLICHIAFDQPPLTRKERANSVRKRNYFAKYSGLAKDVLGKLLEKYEAEGIFPLEKREVLQVQPLNEMGSPIELVRAFGSAKAFDAAVRELEAELYKSA